MKRGQSTLFDESQVQESQEESQVQESQEEDRKMDAHDTACVYIHEVTQEWQDAVMTALKKAKEYDDEMKDMKLQIALIETLRAQAAELKEVLRKCEPLLDPGSYEKKKQSNKPMSSICLSHSRSMLMKPLGCCSLPKRNAHMQCKRNNKSDSMARSD